MSGEIAIVAEQPVKSSARISQKQVLRDLETLATENPLASS